MEDPLITEGEGDGKNGGDKSENSEDKRKDDEDCRSPNKIRIQKNTVRPITGGAVNCLLAVDNVIRATSILETSKRISLLPVSVPIPDDDENERDPLLLPLQNTRHLFVREYKKPLKWPMQATKKFQILNSNGDCIYYAAERSLFFNKIMFLRGIFPYKISVLSVGGEQVLEIHGKPFFFSNCLTIQDAKGHHIGKIKKSRFCCSCAQKYALMTWDGTQIMNVKGPEGSNCCCLFADCGGNEFDVNLRDSTLTIGKISAEWEYVLEDLCGVFVPMKLDEMSMTLLLGTLFLIDFNFYQRKRDVSCFSKCFTSFFLFGLFILLLFLIAKK